MSDVAATRVPAGVGNQEHTGAQGAALVLTAAVLFGTIGTARVLGPAASSASVGAVRLILAAGLLLLIAMPHGFGTVRQAWRLPGVWLAGGAQAAFNITFLGAVTRAGVAVGTLVAIGCTPILTGLISRQWTRSWLKATGLALLGLTALMSQGLGHHSNVSGILYALGAAASYATFIVSSSALSRSPIDVGVKLAAIFTVAAVALTPALLIFPLDWAQSASGIAMVVYLALACTVLAYNLFNRGLCRVAPGTAATLGLAEPLIATLLGVAVIGEQLSPLGWAGATVIVFALALMVRTTRPAAVPDAVRPS